MSQRSGMRKTRIATTIALLGATAAAALQSGFVQAAIEINPASVNMFRDSRGIAGEYLQYGANVIGGSLNTFLSATHPPTVFVDAAAPCGPSSTNPNLCASLTPYNPARTTSPWSFTFTRAGETPLTVTGPSLAGTDFKVPQPTSVSIGGSGVTPTISWTLPAGYVPDGFRAQIFDESVIRPSGGADIIHVVTLTETAASYTFPSVLSTGQSLRVGGNYSINFQVIETRGDVAFTGSNAQILTRSFSLFSFTPLDSSAPPAVFLPEVGPDPTPGDAFGAPYVFSVAEVGPSSVTFVDPFVAIGYDYAIGAGDPNFASVILPNVGDGEFTVIFDGPGGPVEQTLEAGEQFFFQAGGVSAFSVRGIEESAGLDPANVTAFVTGLTFVAEGAFTGTMTPLQVFVVPEPETYALMLAGLGLVVAAARRRSRRLHCADPGDFNAAEREVPSRVLHA